MGNGVGLIANKVVESVGAVGVDEAIANPFTSSYAIVMSVNVLNSENAHSRLANVSDDLESCLHTILLDLSGLHSFDVGLSGESKDIESILASNGHELAAI